MSIWAIVPVKPFSQAKSRLATALKAEAREALAEKLFRHGLSVLQECSELRGVLVVSRDTKALAIARDYKANTLQERESSDLNTALTRAAEVIQLQNAEGILIVPADLPLYTRDDIEEILRQGRYGDVLVIAPDRREDGTNAMLIKPPSSIPFAFGIGSFQRHLALAAQAEVATKIVRREGLALDLDTPDDWAYYNSQSGEPMREN
jgi:2-phospho-L-lactate guanylyltransferase